MRRVLVSNSSVHGLTHHKGALDGLIIRIWVEQQLANDGLHNRYIDIEEQLIPSSNKMGVVSVHDRNN
jgi:hypothetical protein